MKDKLYKPLIVVISAATLIGASMAIVRSFDCSNPENFARCSRTTSDFDPDLAETAVLSTAVETEGLGEFQGLWGVDYDLTLEEVKKSPDYSQEELDQMPEIIKGMLAMMQIQISGNGLIYRRGSTETSLPCSVEEVSGASTLAVCTVKDQAVEVTFTLINGEYMNLKSSGSDDLDFYIWKRIE
ncbi:MAG: hypothetical protein QNJ46_10470 [Leptolyngbyaceae cyanobacterium MO_188.B28]|nr:hypothetical protein [Leptolyngbyaceae cyanobacterium MO_188.B28]